jgi:hypothetical protein
MAAAAVVYAHFMPSRPIGQMQGTDAACSTVHNAFIPASCCHSSSRAHHLDSSRGLGSIQG